MEKMTIEFWVVFQMFIDLVLVVMVLYLLKNFKSGMQKQVSSEAAGNVINMIDPLLKEATSVASEFDTQLKEKKHLINTINKKIDNHIITLNLLLNRTEAHRTNASLENDSLYDQHEKILALHRKGNDTKTIARLTSVPKDEVDLVINMKKKFLAIEEV